MSTKDVYGTMAPMAYTRGLGSSPSKPRQSPPPAIAGRPHAPSLRGQIGRLKRRKRQDGVKALVEVRGRLSGVDGLDDEAMAIYRVASGLDQPARDLTGIKSAMARIETKSPQPSDDTERCLRCHEDIVGWYEVEDGAKHGFPGYDAVVCLGCAGVTEQKGAPSRMPPQLINWWATTGRPRWDGATPYRSLRSQLRAHGVPGRMVDGATANVFRRAYGIYPGQRPNGGKKSLQDALARL